MTATHYVALIAAAFPNTTEKRWPIGGSRSAGRGSSGSTGSFATALDDLKDFMEAGRGHHKGGA
jgi:hypothetical protein